LANAGSNYLSPSRLASGTVIKKVIITPTRIIKKEEPLFQSNRMLRKFGHENFLQVDFRNEYLQSFQEESFFWKNRLNAILSNGVYIDGQRFQFIGHSNSGLKQYSFWFIRNNNDFSSIWGQMGDFTDIKCIAKCSSRMAQCFSTSSDVGPVEINEIQDIQRGEYNFTDGIGNAGSSCFESIRKALKIERDIHAVQIRIGGFKGVIARNPLMDCGIQLRKSMNKFPSGNFILLSRNHI
jgi:RNA-dependent RNA polymerase